MEYRLKYRDIPWHVAIFVLPGKIGGTVFIKWPSQFAKNWQRNIGGLGVCLLMLIVIMALLYFITSGDVNPFTSLLRIMGINI